MKWLSVETMNMLSVTPNAPEATVSILVMLHRRNARTEFALRIRRQMILSVLHLYP